MRIYAERPGRAARQVLADVAVLTWTLLVLATAEAARAALGTLRVPAERLAGAGESIRGTFDGAARSAADVPFVGDDLARALGVGTGAGDSLVASGTELAAGVSTAADAVALAIVLVGALPVLLGWLLLRGRWVLAARSAATARTADPDLLALRALTGRPAGRLLAVHADPAAAWRRADPEAVRALAAVELRALGLRPR